MKDLLWPAAIFGIVCLIVDFGSDLWLTKASHQSGWDLVGTFGILIFFAAFVLTAWDEWPW